MVLALPHPRLITGIGAIPILRALLSGLLILVTVGQLEAFSFSAMAAAPAFTLHGRIQRLSGNRMPGPSRPPAPPSVHQELVVVAGALRPWRQGDPFLPEAQLRASILGRTRSDGQGQFHLKVPAAPDGSAVVTVLLVVPGGFYLNAFDHQGCFASIDLREVSQPLLLTDDRGALF